MKRYLVAVFAVAGLCLLAAAAEAHPRGRGGWSFSFYSAGPAYYAPPPVVYAPAPVMVPAAPVYVQQPYYYPAPYYYVPPPPPRAFIGFGF